MSRLFLITLLAAFASAPTSAQPSGKDIVKKMYDRYAGKWYRTFTFNQTTEMHRAGAPATQTWFEFIRFPDRFRMDFGPVDSGNAAIFRGDSCYRFRNGQLRTTTINNNEGLIFLLGGMYFHPLDQTYALFTSLGYDLSKGHEDTWKGQPVYVIGANKGEDNVNQLWIHRQNGYLLRMIKPGPTSKFEALFEDWQPAGGGWLETKCSFYVDGKLLQVETYHDWRVDVSIDDNIFDPAHWIRSH